MVEEEGGNVWCDVFFFFQAEDGIRDLVRSRGLGDVYKRQAYVPIDPTYPAGRQHTLAVDAGVDLVLTQGTATPDPDTFPVPVLSLDRLNAELETLSGENLDRPISADQAAYVIYTSGSTGKPKGVVVSHGALCEHLVACLLYTSPSPRDRTRSRMPSSA